MSSMKNYGSDAMGDMRIAPASNNQGGALANAEVAKQVQEVQAALVIAKRFPRDENAAHIKIMTACKRVKLAESAMYVYPKGRTTVTGPSIRLAEVLARSWGNLNAGIREVARHDGYSEMQAFCWDIESNVKFTRDFYVKHIRDTKSGSYELKDQRDIYEATANQGARRLRACILECIPEDVVEAAVEQCEKTLAGDTSEPIKDRIKKMLARFDEIQVSSDMIEKRLGHKIDTISEAEMVELHKVFKSIKDNFGGIDEFFDVPKVSTNADLQEKLIQARENGTQTAETIPAAGKGVKGDDPTLGIDFSGESGSAVPEEPKKDKK